MTTVAPGLICEETRDLLGSSSAVLSAGRAYRYLLTRGWGDGPPVVFVMLNPSTAGAFTDDPTVRRCVMFARREGCGSLRVVNLFGLRGSRPRELRKHPDPVGPCNDRFIEEQARDCLVIAAWGADGALSSRGHEIGCRLGAAGIPLHCLGVTSAGHPRHPLYVRGDAPLMPWQAPLEAPARGPGASAGPPEATRPGAGTPGWA